MKGETTMTSFQHLLESVEITELGTNPSIVVPKALKHHRKQELVAETVQRLQLHNEEKYASTSRKRFISPLRELIVIRFLRLS